MPRLVKVNDHGRRIGEDHPRAVLLDHEVELLLTMLAQRDEMIERMAGDRQADIDKALTAACMSYRCLAATFEVHKQTIAKIASGSRRGQRAARTKAYP